MTTTLRIGIVEDDDRLRGDFADLIEAAADLSCIARFESAEDALKGLETVTPDVMLVDINLPGISGIEFVRKMRASGGTAQVIMLTTFEDATVVFEALKAGANGYLLKRAALAELCDAIHDVAAGGAP